MQLLLRPRILQRHDLERPPPVASLPRRSGAEVTGQTFVLDLLDRDPQLDQQLRPDQLEHVEGGGAGRRGEVRAGLPAEMDDLHLAR